MVDDPARWVVETSTDGGAAWRPAVACAWVTVWVGAAAGGGDAGPASFRVPAGGAARFADCGERSVDLGPDVSLAAPLPGAEVRVDVRPDMARLMEVRLSARDVALFYLFGIP